MANDATSTPSTTPSPEVKRAAWCEDCWWGLAETLWLNANGDVPGMPFDALADDERRAWFDHAEEVAGGAS